MIELRGDIHEGGGQILRTALALAARTGQAFRLTHIRAGRSRPGLQAQHLAAVRLAAQLCNARLRGDALHSTELSFEPGPLRRGSFQVDIDTAGSMTLLLQATFWALAAAPGPCEVEVRGGSDVSWSPPLDYLEEVTLPLYRELAPIETVEKKRGFFPKGQGLWRFRSQPGDLTTPLDLAAPPQWRNLGGRAVAARDLSERRVAERLAERAGALLEAPVEVEYARSASTGTALTLWAEDERLRCGVGVLGEKGKSSEQVAEAAVFRLREKMERTEPVEEYLADQLVPLLALVGGRMRCQELSPHCLANLEVAAAFLGPRIRRFDSLLTTLPYEVVVMVGLQASGKSTYARSHLPQHRLVSKDLLRNNSNRQRRQMQLLEKALQAGEAVVVDNTNPAIEDRQPLIEAARKWGAPVRAVFVDTPRELCWERNATREGAARVPEVGLKVVHSRLQPPTLEEGFSEVLRL
ncbi:MAG: RNA 3'-phosphate cyclase [Candidatus Eremiobacteraeota bacterium]|nr:RNA 3'-phosphate cyclase [Candidatus Eremiobacteraeota bacterium]